MAQKKKANKNQPNKTVKNRKFLRRNIKNRELLINATIMIIGFIVVFLTINSSSFYGVYNLKPGSVLKEDLYLQNDVIDYEATDRLKEQRASEVTPIMMVDFSKQAESKKNLTDFFARLTEIQNEYANDVDLMKRVFAGIERKNIYGLSESELMSLVTLSAEKIDLVKNYVVDITTENMTSGITADDLDGILSNNASYISAQNDINTFEKEVVLKMISNALVENKFVDSVKTDEKVNSELLKVEDVVYKKGTLFLTKDSVLTESNYSMLKTAGVIVESTWDSIVMTLGLLFMLLILWSVLHLYLSIFEKEILSSQKKYAILMSLFLTFFLSASFFYEISPYLLPIPAFLILASVMITPTVAINFGLGLLVLIAMWTDMNAYTMIAYLLAILIIRALVKNIRQRSQMASIGLYVSLILMVFTLAQGLINKTDISTLPYNIMFAAANGVLSAILSIGIMPFFESFFGVLTPFKIMELTNPNRPLLKRLLLEAPGTYHHSILVGNLAETAAHDIGANSLLVRVAAFYHDVGKLERPYYFKENQVAHENPHDKLPPQVSANFIKNHMSHGMELLRKNKLPEEIIDVIKAHHGNSLIKYFYHREQLSNPDVDVTKFLYQGPKPDTKEAVILMLADSIEAAVRSVEEPTQESITELIEKIISQKIAENQFSNANLTFKELETIKTSFLSVLSGIFHERIAYPEINMNQISKSTFDQTEKES